MKFDLIIVGAGLVGGSLALALKNSGLTIALVDKKPQKIKEDPRLFALNASSCQLLANLSLWQGLAPFASPIHDIHVSRRGHFGAVRLRREIVELASLGYVIPAIYLENALMDALLSSNIHYFSDSNVINLSQEKNEIIVTLKQSDTILSLKALKIIAADGSHSKVRELLRIPIKEENYQQTALVTRTLLNRPHQHIAYERFVDSGAIAMLPLRGNECASIWTADNEKISELMQLNETDFLTQLQQEFGYRLGKLIKIHKRFSYPLTRIEADKKALRDILLIGNAAHTLHPIAAQGFNLALYEIAFIVEKITETINEQKSIHDLSFESLSSQIENQQKRSMNLSHRLAYLFIKRSKLLNTFLQMGMIAFDLMNPLKKIFIEKTLGKSQSIPRLLLNMEK